MIAGTMPMAEDETARSKRDRWWRSAFLVLATIYIALLLAGLLLMAPLGLVPFSNTLPALGVLFLSLGILERDGLFIVGDGHWNKAGMDLAARETDRHVRERWPELFGPSTAAR